MFWIWMLVVVCLVVLVPQVVEWAKPISRKRSVGVVWTREERVAEAKRAAESEARWVRLVKYSHWLEDNNPICKVHEKSYARMLHNAQVQELARDIMREDVDALDVRSKMLVLKELDKAAWSRVCDIVLA